MDDSFCPGAKLRSQAKPEVTDCPFCGEEVEIWSDEKRTTCSECKKTIIKDFIV